MPLLVQKYGGSSLATPRHIQRAARRIKDVKASGKDLVVVVSAMGRMTDHLIALAHRTVKTPPQRELDMLLSTGERISMALLAMALQEQGVPAISFTGSQSGIVTTPHHTDARILDIRAHRIRDELARGKVVIIAGFQGVSEQKEITTLGRGGSDTTAVALAAALGAESCEILTDVDGLFSADPRVVPQARLLPHCSYDEALELASLGAKMQSRSIEVAKRFRVKVRIAASGESRSSGTLLSDEIALDQKDTKMEETIIRGIATREGYHFFHAHTTLPALLKAVKGHHIGLRFFAATGGEVRFVCEKEKVAVLKERLEESAIRFEEMPKVLLVSAVGDGLSASAEELPRFLETLHDTGAECLMVCSNSLSITAAIPASFKEPVARELHARLIEKTC